MTSDRASTDATTNGHAAPARAEAPQQFPEARTTTAERRVIKCECCAVPWEVHTDACRRHEFRPAIYAVAGRLAAACRAARDATCDLERDDAVTDACAAADAYDALAAAAGEATP